ncbi:MAG: hypothetical protein ACRD8W_05140 [Nitrososphaeraceae archaeon]
MQTKAYIMAIVLLSTIGASLFVGNSMVYSSSDDDDDDDDENNDENDPCYKAGFEAGSSSGSFNQTQQSNCGSTGQAYYEGFISGCISSGGGDYSACDAKTG